jgi:anti-sigma regulatory factor (Ser/Thr protein kinase)
MSMPVNLLVHSFPSVPLSARAARDFVVAELDRNGISATTIVDFELIVSELVANGVQHGDGTPVVVTVDTGTAGWVAVSISSGVNGSVPPLDAETWTVADAEMRSGRGLGIVRRLADEVATALDAGRLTITCRRRG